MSIIPGVIASGVRPNSGGSPSVLWGSNHQGIDNGAIVSFCNKLGITHLREQILLKDYDGGTINSFETFINAGIKLVVNLNWEAGHGDPPPENFPSDQALYRSKIRLALQAYGPHIEVAVIENEPTNNGYFNQVGFPGTYLTEFGWAADECIQAGVKVTDGALHTSNFNPSGVYPNITVSPTSSMVTQYLDGIAARGATYCNFHFHIPDQFTTHTGSDYTTEHYQHGFIKAIVDYMKNRTGLDAMCNEYHQNVSANGIANPDLTRNLVQEMKLSGVLYSIAFVGNGDSGGQPFSNFSLPIVLTEIGQAYADEIAL